jgi:putative ABC transport system substrate-binding protein
MDVVKTMAPATTRAALIHNPNTTPYWTVYLRSDEAAAVSKAVRLIGAPVRSAAEWKRRLPTSRASPVEA